MQLGETWRFRDGGASLSAVELQDNTEREDFVPVFVEAIKIQPVMGKLICLLPLLLHGKSPDVDKVLLAVQSVSPKEPEAYPIPELCKRLQDKA